MVIISHLYRFIYLKNYKVAGSSIESFFGQFCIDPALQSSYEFTDICDECITPYGIVNKRYGENFDLSENKLHIVKWIKEYVHNNHNTNTILWFPHKSAKHIREDIGEEIFNQYLKFCVIRNPYDTIISAYFWSKAYYNITHDFKTYCKQYCKQNMVSRNNNYIRHDNNRLFIDNQPVCDYYIRYEHLKEDTTQLLEKLGITNYNLDDLPHHKGGFRPKDKPYQEYYDDETRELVYETFKQIIDMFHYTF